jgi:hypothetical protein
MTRNIVLSSFIFLIVPFFLTSKRPPDYILIEYEGVLLEKTVPKIIFSVEPFHREVFLFADIFRVNKYEFLLICDEIKESETTIKSDTTDFLNFYIVRKNTKELYTASNTEKIKKLFMTLADQIDSENKRSMVRMSFELLSARF